MKRLLFFLISIGWILFSGQQAQACTCIEYGTPVCAAYWRADAVFAGQLREITPVEKKSDNELPTVMLHFIVEQPFRGVTTAQLDVATLSGTSCDMSFDKGRRYLIYASRDGSQLFAGPCTRTTELEHADDDLNYIRNLMQQGANESVAGRLVRNKYDPLSGQKINVLSGSKTLEAVTDEKGEFSLSLPGPGDYTVRAFVPFAATVISYAAERPIKEKATDALTTIEYKIEIAKNQCDYREIDVYKIDLHATAEVSGAVLTASGRPLGVGLVHLINTADPDDNHYKRLEDNGVFKFEAVAVGEYYLVLNPRNEAPDHNDAPYPRTYYPSAPDSNAATKIVVTEGAKLENLTLRLGRPWKERGVSGKVVWQDGRAVGNAHVSLYDGERYVELIKLDEKGKFSLKVYGDFKYSIIAESWGEIRARSERVPITSAKSKGLTLILKPVE